MTMATIFYRIGDPVELAKAVPHSAPSRRALHDEDVADSAAADSPWRLAHVHCPTSRSRAWLPHPPDLRRLPHAKRAT
jgi:hypothetical protein